MAMKKRYLALLPLMFLVSGCDINGVKISFADGNYHSAGLDKSYSMDDYNSISYSYKNNDTLNNEGLNSVILTFENIDASETNVQDLAKIKSYLSLTDQILDSVSNPSYFNTLSSGVVFLGTSTEKVLGEITLNFNVEIKNVEILAKPYYYVDNTFNNNELVVDEDVAISLNDEGYIKINKDIDEENQTVNSSTCSYKLQEAKNTINIKVGKRRAILEKITLYY